MLTAVDRAIIDLERTWFTLPGPKEWAITQRVGVEPVEYYDRLATLLTSSEAEDYDQFTVRRLRRFVASVPSTAGGV